MLQFLLQLPSGGLPQQTPMIPELPPGPSLDRVRGPIDMPFPETWQIVLIALLGIVVAGLLGWQLLRTIRTRKGRHPSTSPYSAALAELKSAAELTAGDEERFAVMSSLALRRYFETSKGIEALGRTTDEFLESLRAHSILNANARESLAEFLQHCDRVKFARLTLGEAERSKLTESALAVIRQCEITQTETGTQNAQS